ncbi:MAG TPA: hypothetical protein VFG20_17190, partial [Planctomycetaceae bacterium]|nr:hypothetical protein [Planctomycetaceae bacterium]
MNKRPADHERLLTLLDAVCEERASAAQFAEIEALVAATPEARWVYLTYIDLHGTLSWDAGGGLGTVTATTEVAPAATQRRPSAWSRGALLALAGCVIAVVAGINFWPQEPNVPVAVNPPAPIDDPHRSPQPQNIAPHTKKPVQLPAHPGEDVIRNTDPIIATHNGTPSTPNNGVSPAVL